MTRRQVEGRIYEEDPLEAKAAVHLFHFLKDLIDRSNGIAMAVILFMMPIEISGMLLTR